MRAKACWSRESECKLHIQSGEQSVPAHRRPASTPPPIIGTNDRRLLCYAVLDKAVGYNPDHGRLFVGGKPIWRLPCLAISEDKNSSEFTLCCCKRDWSPVGIAGCRTVAGAKTLAERIYRGSSACRTKASRFSLVDRKKHLDKAFADMRCSSCGKRPDETISGEGFSGKNKARICGDGVRKFYDVVIKRSRRV